MANSLVIVANSGPAGSGQTTFADASTNFVPLAGLLGKSATEADMAVPVRDAGDFSNLYINVTANDVASATSATITLRKTAANTAVTVSYGSSQTGVKENTTNSVTYAATDTADYSVVVTSVSGSHSIAIAIMGCQFAPTTTGNCVSFLAASKGGGISLSTASANFFQALQGTVDDTGTEVNLKVRINQTFTGSNLFSNVLSNARTTNTIVKTRKNGADGAQSVTYSSSQTGTKEDTTNTDSLVSGDDYCFDVLTSTGTGAFVLALATVRLVSTASYFMMAADGPGAGFGFGFNLTRYFGVSQNIDNPASTESVVQIYPRFGFTASQLAARVGTNTIATSASTIRTRAAGANGNQSLSYAAAETGVKTDASNTDVLTSGTTQINYQIVTPNTSGTLTIQWLALLGSTVSAAFIAAVPVVVGQAVKRASYY